VSAPLALGQPREGRRSATTTRAPLRARGHAIPQVCRHGVLHFHRHFTKNVPFVFFICYTPPNAACKRWCKRPRFGECVACGRRPQIGGCWRGLSQSRVEQRNHRSRMAASSCPACRSMHGPQLRDHPPFLRGSIAVPARSFLLSRRDRHESHLLEERAHAERLQARFGGEFIDPKDRPKWPGSAR